MSSLRSSFERSTAIDNTWLHYTQKITNPVLPSLTVTVTQEAQLHDILLTFTVPIKAGAPTEKWTKEKGAK